MKLKALIADLKEVDEKYHDLYEKTDAGYVLSLDDGEYKKKVGEFRNNNLELKKQVEGLSAQVEKYKGVDPEKARAAEAKLRELEEKQMMDDGKIDELVNLRTDRMRQEFTGQNTALQSRAEKAENEAKALKNRLTRIAVDDGISKAVQEVAMVKKGAMADILSRSAQVWSVDDEGNLVAKTPDGNTIYGKEGKAPITPTEWSQQLMSEAPFLFEQSTGGGAQGGKKAPSGDGKTIDRSDKEAFASNLEAIAKGSVQVK